MKRLILTIALTSAVTAAPALAQGYRDDYRPAAYVAERGYSLERHINHLNRMVSHVRWQLRRYHAGWQTRREFEAISREVDRVNWRYRHSSAHRWGLRRDVDRLHDRLHAIEQRLHVRSHDFYRWD